MTGADTPTGPKSLLDICIDFFAAQLLSGFEPPLSSSEGQVLFLSLYAELM